MIHRMFPIALLCVLGLGVLLFAAEAQACFSRQPQAPHGVVVSAPLPQCDEDAQLRAGRRPVLYAVADSLGRYKPERKPAVLVHGLSGHPADFASLSERLSGSGYQVYVLFFDDMGRRISENGAGLADALADLFRHLGKGRDLMLLGHSAGGLISRHALNLLSARGLLSQAGVVDFYAIDTPWHGYFGPSDRTLFGRLRMGVARPFLPDGIEDMRAESLLFLGNPQSPNPALRTGLLRYQLPDTVRIHMYFAQEGDEVHDYTEGLLSELSERVANYYASHTLMRSSPQIHNFWMAIISSHSYYAFQDELRGMADAGQLTPAVVRSALLRYFPRLPGDHSGVLHEQPSTSSPTLLASLPVLLAANLTSDP